MRKPDLSHGPNAYRGAPPLRANAKSEPKRYRAGTHRSRTPEESWRSLEPLLLTVGVTRVADVTALDVLGLPVHQAIRPGSRNLCVSQGKGTSHQAARVGAAMEAIELWHAEDLDDLPQVELTVRDVAATNPIPLAALAWRKCAKAFDRGRSLRWLTAFSLCGGDPAWLPRDGLELDLRLRPVFDPPLFHRSSNGLAAGNTLSEALVHGLCELLERHALALAKRDPGRLVGLREGSISSPGCRDLLGRFRDAGMKIRLYDATGGAPVAVLKATLAAPDLPTVWHGSGCHPSPEIALSRALTEVAQTRLTTIAGVRDDLSPAPADDPQRVFRDFAEAEGEADFERLPSLATKTIDGDLSRLLEALAADGHDPFYVDLSRPALGVPVVRTFIPGLQEDFLA